MKRTLRSNSLPTITENPHGRHVIATTTQSSSNKSTSRRMKWVEARSRSSMSSSQHFPVPSDVVKNGGHLKRTAQVQSRQATTNRMELRSTSAQKQAQKVHFRGESVCQTCGGRGTVLNPRKEPQRPGLGAMQLTGTSRNMRSIGRGQIAKISSAIIARPRGTPLQSRSNIKSAPPVKKAKTIAMRASTAPQAPSSNSSKASRALFQGRENRIVGQNCHGEPMMSEMIGKLSEISLEKSGKKQVDHIAKNRRAATDVNQLVANFTSFTVGVPAKKRKTGNVNSNSMEAMNQMIGKFSNCLLGDPAMIETNGDTLAEIIAGMTVGEKD